MEIIFAVVTFGAILSALFNGFSKESKPEENTRIAVILWKEKAKK